LARLGHPRARNTYAPGLVKKLSVYRIDTVRISSRALGLNVG